MNSDLEPLISKQKNIASRMQINKMKNIFVKCVRWTIKQTAFQILVHLREIFSILLYHPTLMPRTVLQVGCPGIKLI